MPKRLTITLDDDVYEGLLSRLGRRGVSRLLNELARRTVAPFGLEEGYKAMAADEQGEREALEWVEGASEDVTDDPYNGQA
ncbi:MAG: hypothetical protein ACRED5_00330 [Propylenella sp.]